MQEEIESRNVSATSICFSGGAPPEVGDNLAENRGEEVIVHDMNNFNRRLISSIRVTEEGALKTNMWVKKRKREISSALKAIDNVNQKKIQNAMESSVQEAARKVAAIMSTIKVPQNGQSNEP